MAAKADTGSKKSQQGVSASDNLIMARHGYLLKATIGEGNYSKVKVAESVRGASGNTVAIKIINTETAPADFRCRFLPRELKIWPNVQHPNIIRLYEVIQTPLKVYIVLEYAEGGDLLTYIQERGRGVREAVAQKWLYQLCEAVRYMHLKAGIAHRDLKLENVLLDAHKNVKLTDFGFARKLHTGHDEKDSRFTEYSRTHCGSKAYACPEILRSIPYEPKKADIWALGCILYILVTGKMPFNEHQRETKQIVEQQRNMRLPWMTARQTPISSACKMLALKMLSFDANKRPDISQVMKMSWLSVASELQSCPATLHRAGCSHGHQDKLQEKAESGVTTRSNRK